MKIITISGIATSGKTTLSNILAETLGGVHINPHEYKSEPLLKEIWDSLSWKTRNGILFLTNYYLKAKHHIDENRWVIFDHGFLTNYLLDHVAIADFFGLREFYLKGHHFCLFIPFEEYVSRKKQRDGIIVDNDKIFKFLLNIHRQNVRNGMIPLDGTKPISVNVETILEHVLGKL